MLENEEKNGSEKNVGDYWATEGHIDLMNDIGEFFSLTDVQECADDPSSIVQLDDSDTTKSSESMAIVTDGTNSSNSTECYHDLDIRPSTPSSEASTRVTQCEWQPFIPLKSSTIQILGNEIRLSPKQPSQVNSEESVQVQVPPLRVPIIRRIEDTSKEKPKINNKSRKSLENVQKKPLKKKPEGSGVKESNCKIKGSKRQYRKGRNLENEFTGESTFQPAPTVTIHHHAPVTGQSGNHPTQESQMKSHFPQEYQMYRDASLQNNGQPQSLISNSSVNTVMEAFGNSNAQRGPGAPLGHNFQRAQMISDPRKEWSDQIRPNDQGQLMSNRSNAQQPPNVCVNSNGMFSRMQDFHEGASRGYSTPDSANTPVRTPSQDLSTENQRRAFQNSSERFEQVWQSSSLSPVERLFRNRISEVSEVRERSGDVQKFMKNSQLYKQLLAPIKDESTKGLENGDDSKDMMEDVKKIPQFKEEQSSQRYDLPNEWTKVPTVPKPVMLDPMRSVDSKRFDGPNYINFNQNIRRDQFSQDPLISGNPYDHVNEINEHFSKNDNLHNSDHESVPSSKQMHLPNWLKPHTISKDYQAMFMEILKLRFCIYSERSRNNVLQTENGNLRALMNLQRNLQATEWGHSAKISSSCENISSGGGHGTYFRTQDNMEHLMNPGVNNLHQNDMFDPKYVSNTFGQLSRESIHGVQRNGHVPPQNNVYYNGGSDCNVVPHQQRQPHNFGSMNMMRL